MTELPLGGVLPRERILALGPAALTDVDLIALILGTGGSGENVFALARRILADAGDLRVLAEAHPAELMRLHGLGTAKAARITAAVELGRRIATQRWQLGEPFTSSRQVFQHYHPLLRDEKRELFFSIFLDARNRLIGEQEISRGSLVASLVHPREVYRPAIRLAAAALICIHNHPSGDPASSSDDIAITHRLFQVGQTIGIPLLDHIIVGDGEYCSFVDRGLPPFDTHSSRPATSQ